MSIERVSVFKTEDGRYCDTEDEAKSWDIALNVLSVYEENPLYIYDPGCIPIYDILKCITENTTWVQNVLELPQNQIKDILRLEE